MLQPSDLPSHEDNLPATASRWQRRAKRGLDVTLALLVLVISSPLLIVLALLVRLTSPGPASFRQIRVGRFGRPFVMYKFRTMQVDQDDSAQRQMVAAELTPGYAAPTSDGAYKIENDPRLTPIGTWLRRTSVDELPQLWNVVRGDMSLVGPRPSLPWEVELYEARHRERELERPGITGLWQVEGRNLVSTIEMLELDLRYVHSRSLRMDLGILLRTPLVVIRGDGAR